MSQSDLEKNDLPFELLSLEECKENARRDFAENGDPYKRMTPAEREQFHEIGVEMWGPLGRLTLSELKNLTHEEFDAYLELMPDHWNGGATVALN